MISSGRLRIEPAARRNEVLQFIAGGLADFSASRSVEDRRWPPDPPGRQGVLRFHAVYWPAILLSAGLPLPTDILVHDYLTIDGRKISKSGGTGLAASPDTLAGRFGTDAVRWWLLREVPRVGDTDFTVARLITRANDDLANGLGNLVSRVTSMAHRYRQGRLRPTPGIPAAGAGEAAACDDSSGRLPEPGNLFPRIAG